VDETREHFFADFYGTVHIEVGKGSLSVTGTIEEDERLSGTIDALVANQNPLAEHELLRIDDLDRDDNTLILLRLRKILIQTTKLR
jgi:hypothetical protein